MYIYYIYIVYTYTLTPNSICNIHFGGLPPEACGSHGQVFQERLKPHCCCVFPLLLAAGRFFWPNLKECWGFVGSRPAMVLKENECRIAGSRNANLHFQWEFIADQFVHLSSYVFGIFSYLIGSLWARQVMLHGKLLCNMQQKIGVWVCKNQICKF